VFTPFTWRIQKQRRVAVGPGTGHFIYIRQVSSVAATLRRCTCGQPLVPAAAADATAINLLIDN